ncbi:Glu-tRNA(Gln) amidotransferase subunit GatD [Candidatus Woesearchaeota archaeon]|nr:Glu-tRNA(Gln) amidotransferase subunit GatD [Candidatus Woesearchaeota archaeon]
MTLHKPGDKVKVVTKEGEKEGIFVNEENNSVFIKLDNGYNIGIDKKNIKKIEKVGDGKKLEITHRIKLEKKKGLPNITILHTGGTIASKVDYRTGAVFASFSPEDLIGMFPELSEIANFDSKLAASMFSEDMRFKLYSLMAKEIEKEVKKGVDGIILTHGTDTMGYSAAALAFMLEDLPIPVIIVGSQRSSDRGSSDAGVNLICAAEFIAKTDFAGVAICMHESMEDKTCAIMPPCKTRKLHTSRRDAFKVVNDTIIARINFEMSEIATRNPPASAWGKRAISEHAQEHAPPFRAAVLDNKKIEFIKKDYTRKDKNRKLKVKDEIEEKIALLKIHPNMHPDQFKSLKGYKGIVLEGTGLGHAPVGVPNDYCKINKENFKAIEELAKNSVVVMASQTLFGRVDMNVYSTGRDLLKAGVIPGEDMLPETAFVKLAWLLGNYKKEEVKELIGRNLRGEINERIMPDEFLE